MTILLLGGDDASLTPLDPTLIPHIPSHVSVLLVSCASKNKRWTERGEQCEGSRLHPPTKPVVGF